eukprot:gene7715-13542_t
MDTDPAVTLSPSICKLGMKTKSVPKMVDSETSVDLPLIKGEYNGQQSLEQEPGSSCNCCGMCSFASGALERSFEKIGKSGVGSWKTGTVPEDAVENRA